MKEREKTSVRPFMALLLCALMLTLLIPSLGQEAGAVEPYDLTTELVDMDGNVTTGPMEWDLDSGILVWDDQTSTIHREIPAAQYVEVTNTGTFAWNVWYLNLTSSNGGGLDLSVPGSWYVTHGSLDDYTNTTTQTLNVPGGMEVLEGIVDRFEHDSNPNNDNAIPALQKNIVKMEQGVGQNKSVTSYNNQKTGTPNESPVAINYTLAAGESVYFHFILVMDALPATDEYTIDWEIRGFDTYESLLEMTDLTPTKAVGSDPLAGSSTLGITDTTEIALSYTGLHDTDIYFPQLISAVTTVPSYNEIRITNTGNQALISIKMAVGLVSYWNQGGTQTSYAMNGNTQAAKFGGVFQNLDPSYIFTEAVIPGGFQDMEMRLLNAALPEVVDDYWASVEVTGYSQWANSIKSGAMIYAPYSGTLACSLTYSSGTSLAFPLDVTPGDQNVLTANYGIITNTVVSDFTVDTLEFKFLPLTHSFYAISFVGGRVQLSQGAISEWFTLESFTSGGNVYGRAAIDLPASTLTELAPGDDIDFIVEIDVQSGLPAGSYTGSFVVTCSANPIQILHGTYDLGEEVTVFEIEPWVDPLTDIEVGDTVDYGATISWNRGNIAWPFIVFRVLNDTDEPISVKAVNISGIMEDAELGNLLEDNLTASIPGGSFIPTEEGNYTVQAYQGVLNGSNVDAIGEPQEVVVHVKVSAEEDETVGAWADRKWDEAMDWMNINTGIVMVSVLTIMLVLVLFGEDLKKKGTEERKKSQKRQTQRKKGRGKKS